MSEFMGRFSVAPRNQGFHQSVSAKSDSTSKISTSVSSVSCASFVISKSSSRVQSGETENGNALL